MLRKYNIKPTKSTLAEQLRQANRFEAFSARVPGLLLDFSRTSLDTNALERLLELIGDSGLEQARDKLFSGARVNHTENRPVLHMAMRDDALLAGVDGATASRVVEARRRMYEFATAFGAGQLPDDPGKRVRHIIHIGIGGSFLGPRLLVEALGGESATEVHFLSSIDAQLRSELLARLDPAETAAVIVTKSFTTGETLLHARRVRGWLEDSLGGEEALQRLFAVSANPDAVADFGISAANRLYMPDWVGGRYSLWSAVSLSAAAVLGSERFAEFLAGAAAMDAHFRQAELPGNLPVLAALAGIWHRNICGYPAQAVIPYDYRLRSLAAYLQQLVMESNGKSVDAGGRPVGAATSPVLFGEPGTDAQHSLFQMFHQGTDVVPLCFIAAVRPDHDDGEAHAGLLANMLAQATALALGTGESVDDPHRRMPGQRPSEIILLDELSPFNLGQLLALYEHKVFVESVVWDINAFDQFGVELGKVVARTIQPALEDGAATVPVEYGLNALLDYIRDRQRDS
jgi:glucose-6-phosphate isomerase